MNDSCSTTYQREEKIASIREPAVSVPVSSHLVESFIDLFVFGRCVEIPLPALVVLIGLRERHPTQVRDVARHRAIRLASIDASERAPNFEIVDLPVLVVDSEQGGEYITFGGCEQAVQRGSSVNRVKTPESGSRGQRPNVPSIERPEESVCPCQLLR